MGRTVEELKERIRAGSSKIPSDKVIRGGMLVNVMTKEIYPADIAIYKDMIAAVGDVDDYVDENTEVIDAEGMYLTPGLIDGHIHSECSKMSITSYAKAVVPHGTTSMIIMPESLSLLYQQDYRQGFKKDEQIKEAICYNTYEEDRKAYSCEKGLHLGKEVITL